MKATAKRLEALCAAHPKFLRKGGLCVALVVTQAASQKGLPLNPNELLTEELGQVAGLGKGAVQKILSSFGITKVLAEEGGRTSRGSMGLMQAYVAALNELHKHALLDIDAAFAWWIQKVNQYFAAEGPRFSFDTGKSLRANIMDLLGQAKEIQAHAGGTNYVGAMLQHLIGAKLDLVLGKGQITHHGFSVADQSTERKGDFDFKSMAVHVTTSPGEALIRKCDQNLRDGFKPLIITINDNVTAATALLNNAGLGDRVDVLDGLQFLTANVFEHSQFVAGTCKVTLVNLLRYYNEIVASCENDPSLYVRLPD